MSVMAAILDSRTFLEFFDVEICCQIEGIDQNISIGRDCGSHLGNK